MSETDNFEELFSECCLWFSDKGVPPHEAFTVMASVVGAIIAQLPLDRRAEAVDLAEQTIRSAMKAAEAAA